MSYLLRLSCFSISAAAIASGVFACSSSTNQGQGALDGGGGGGEAGVGPEGEGGGGGDGSSGGEGGGDGGGPTTSGTILVTQTRQSGTASYSVSAAFRGLAAPTSMGTTAPTSTTVGDCTAALIPVDPNAVAPKGASGLNAGAITLAGSGTPATAMLVYGPMANTGFSNYSRAMGNTAIFAGGDTFTLSGAGGPDLPSFGPQTLVTPNDIVVTSPVCGGTCPDLDRTADLPIAWTGGGAGKVVVTFETIAAMQAVFLQCKFPAAGGSGTVPAALLGKLDKAGDPNVSGIFLISPTNVVDFVVGTTPTTFSVQWGTLESTLTVSN